MATGIVRRVTDKGFGFIERSGGERDCFFHVRDTSPSLPFDASLEGQRVEFDVKQGDRGPVAVNVRELE